MLSLLEIVIAVGLFLKMFGSDGALNSVLTNFGAVVDWAGSGALTKFIGSDTKGPISALALIAGFMIFGFILITAVPGIIDKKEKEFDADDGDF